MAAEIAYTHHERWDGTGYPQGLAGNAIPIEGRISAVADVFDALVSRRVYKPPYSLERSLEILRDGRGSQFDADIVDIFLDNLDAVVEIMEQSTDE
jgi:putative two-component system response regulator